MSEPSKRTPKKKAKAKVPTTELPDDEAIRKLFPKRVVDRINREIGHEPQKRSVDQVKH